MALDVKKEKEDEGREGNVICIHQQEGESRASSPEGSIAKPKPKRNRIPESYASQRSRGPRQVLVSVALLPLRLPTVKRIFVCIYNFEKKNAFINLRLLL